ncbi:hypothetical protein P389DRAFT_174788 [Cystobasidium minutum MCA 4210]|uniref:uncharacterized protein n=1 Tax=Cystobasidium minutum MCA 4210 TaxID=1397322 RepID=UPI0034CF2613|eukprot:jgi/Rhomi1/174788/fgenesh1_kg.8_\
MDGSQMGDASSCLDLVWIIDCTGSMGSYIASATANVEAICEEIIKSERLQSSESLRLAVIAYRDHPPQDVSYVTKQLPFTSDVTQVKEFLKTLYASGGGDGPEAVTAAMKEALELDWRENASRITLLIADAPPHGIGEYGDGFAQGSPDGSDPLQLARQMASLGIALFVVACEPALSQYTYATDFFRALAQISSGTMLPLTNASLLARVIVGSALEHMDMERLIQEVGAAVAAKIHGINESVDEVARELHERLMLRNENTKQLVIENIYRESAEADHNVQVWLNAPDLASAKPHLKRVTGSRFTDKYLEQRYGARSIYRTAPTVPARSTDKTSTSDTTSSASSSSKLASTSSGTPPPASKTASPGSPSRGVVSSFAAFSAPKMSLEETPINSPPKVTTHSMWGSIASPSSTATTGTGTGLGSAFGGLREPLRRSDSMMDDDEDEMNDDSDEDEDGIKLKRGGISLEQAKRIAISSAWRGLRA